MVYIYKHSQVKIENNIFKKYSIKIIIKRTNNNLNFKFKNTNKFSKSGAYKLEEHLKINTMFRNYHLNYKNRFRNFTTFTKQQS